MLGRAAQIGVINPTAGRVGVDVPFKMNPDPPNTYSQSNKIIINNNRESNSTSEQSQKEEKRIEINQNLKKMKKKMKKKRKKREKKDMALVRRLTKLKISPD